MVLKRGQIWLTSSMVRMVDVNVTLYQVFDEHAEHPLLLQILFVECVLVGSEGMTEQNFI